MIPKPKTVDWLSEPGYLRTISYRDFLAGAPMAPPGLVEPAAFVWATRIATGWTVAAECALALLFLAPARLGLHRHRDALLQLFCVTTYAVASVPGFGWLLDLHSTVSKPTDSSSVRSPSCSHCWPSVQTSMSRSTRALASGAWLPVSFS